jgi:glycerol-3-phosphate dehydrogenase
VLANFAEKRWKGQRPLLWGQGLRQALLDEHIYRGILGLDGLEF